MRPRTDRDAVVRPRFPAGGDRRVAGVGQEMLDLPFMRGGVPEAGADEVAGGEDPGLERRVGVGLGEDRQPVAQADVRRAEAW
jgi:hypothetical protein